ncbi:hypothetical protein V6259_02390 [Marinomonas sp. TI.3.20]|uniref:hypothetical protein n=1 Tax=Marinomonas sp. TI.3.20 TaxID=3121296 RepID=UPI00311D4A7E
MMTVRLKQIAFWLVFTLLIIVALTWGVDRILPQRDTSSIGQCDKTEHECTVAMPGEDVPAILAFDNGIHVNTSIPVSISLPPDLANKTNSVRLTLSCKDTYMGVSSIMLTQKPAPTEWRGNIRLPKSEKQKVTWQVKATLIEANGNEQDIWFEFNVMSPNELTPSVNN